MRVLFLLLSSFVLAQSYQGLATSNGSYAYLESHELIMNTTNKLIESQTRYTNLEGQILAKLDNDYRQSLLVPAHKFSDYQNSTEYGIRYDKSVPIMFNKSADGKYIEKRVSKSNRLQVASQGLHYYIKQNIENIIKLKKIKINFVIPGKLDCFDFNLNVREVTDNKVILELAVNAWLLKMFVPKLKMVYQRKTGNLVLYEGFSNITTSNGSNQNVRIEYNY